jgi:hypothetical protein
VPKELREALAEPLDSTSAVQRVVLRAFQVGATGSQRPMGTHSPALWDCHMAGRVGARVQGLRAEG